MILALLAALALATSTEPVPDEAPVPLVDRSSPPPVAPPVPLDQSALVPVAERPGLRVVLLPTPGLRDVRVTCIFERGAAQLAPEGSASYDAFGWTWAEATRRRDSDELAVFEALHDLDVWSWSSRDHTHLVLDAPIAELDPGLDLLVEVLHQPRFVRRDLRRIRESRLRWLTIEAVTDGATLLESGLDDLWVPEDHPLDPRPDAVGWRDLRRRTVKQHHEDLLATAPLTVLVAGDLDVDAVRERILPAFDRVGVAGDPVSEPTFEAPTRTRVLGIDSPGAGRASLGLRLPAPALDHADAAAFRLVAHALGGHFLSRLNADLREARGLTYGVDGTYSAGQAFGVWTVFTEVDEADAGEAIDAIRAQVERVAREGVFASELDDAVRGRVSAWNRTFASTPTAAGVYASRLRVGWTAADARARLDAYGRVTVEDSRRVAATWLGDTPRAWVIVGDRTVLQPQLEDRGLDVEWLPGELVVLGAGVGPDDGTQEKSGGAHGIPAVLPRGGIDE